MKFTGNSHFKRIGPKTKPSPFVSCYPHDRFYLDIAESKMFTIKSRPCHRLPIHAATATKISDTRTGLSRIKHRCRNLQFLFVCLCVIGCYVNDVRISEERYNSRIQALHFCLHNTIKTERIPINLYFRSSTHLILTDFFYLIRILLKIKRTIFICERHPLVPIISTSMKRHKIYGTRNSQRTTNINDIIGKFTTTARNALSNLRPYMRKSLRNRSCKKAATFTKRIAQTAGGNKRIFYIKNRGSTQRIKQRIILSINILTPIA